jgi:hypothetical protein
MAVYTILFGLFTLCALLILILGTETHHHPAGTSASYGPAGGSASIGLTDIQKLKPPGMTHGESNDTTLGSANATMQSSAGWGKPGDAEVTLYLMEAQHIALEAVRLSRLTKLWLFQYPTVGSETTGMTVAFNAWIAELSTGDAAESSDTKITTEMKLHMTGVATITLGSPAA